MNFEDSRQDDSQSDVSELMERLRFKLLEIKFWLHWKLRELKARAKRRIDWCAIHPHLAIAILLFATLTLTTLLSVFGGSGYLFSIGIFLVFSLILNILYSYRTKRMTGRWG